MQRLFMFLSVLLSIQAFMPSTDDLSMGWSAPDLHGVQDVINPMKAKKSADLIMITRKYASKTRLVLRFFRFQAKPPGRPPSAPHWLASGCSIVAGGVTAVVDGESIKLLQQNHFTSCTCARRTLEYHPSRNRRIK
jgi:hypothetical protein